MERWKGKSALFITSQALSLLGSSIVQYAIIWSIVIESGSGRAMAAAALSGFIPQAVMNLAGISFIDRFPRKLLMILSDAVTALAAFVIVLMISAGYEGNMLLYVLLAVRSLGAGVQTPLLNTSLPLLVPRERLVRLNGIVSTLNSLTALAAPALGALLLSILPMKYVLLTDVVTAVFAIVIISCIHFEAEEERTGEGYDRGSISFLKDYPVFTGLLAYQLLLFFLISPTAFMTPLLVTRCFSESYAALSLSEMSYSGGMIAGGVLFIILAEKRKPLNLVFLSGLFYGVMMCALGLSPYFVLYLVFNLLIGIASPVYNSSLNSYIQLESRDEYRGRLFSLSAMTSSLALPCGMLVFGIAADYLELRLIFILCGVCASAVSCFFFRKCCKKENFP